MSTDDVHPFEMHDPLDGFLDDLRRAAADTPAPAAGDALATLFAEGTLAIPVTAEAARRGGSLTRIRIAVAGAVAVTLFGGLGVAGALPAPVQGRVADVVDVVGVHLPDGQHGPTTTTTVTPTTEVHAPVATDDQDDDAPAPADVVTPPPSPAATERDDHGGRDHAEDEQGDDDRHDDGQDRRSGAVARSTTTTVEEHGGDSHEEEDGAADRRGGDDFSAQTRNPDVDDDVHPVR